MHASSVIARAGFVVALTGTAFAQSLNVDVGSNFSFPEPTPAYGAAAGQPGAWTPVLAFFSTNPLVDLFGAATSVTLTTNGGIDFQFPNVATTGDDENLMDDTQDPFSGTTWTFAGLTDGDYTVYTYAWAPDSAALLTDVTVTGAAEGTQVVGGAWAGHALGVTYARHTVTVVGGTLVIDIAPSAGSTFGALNGFQLVTGTTSTTFCNATDNALASCPCANPGSPDTGCDIAAGTGGVRLSLVAQQTSPNAATMQGVGYSTMGAPSVILIRSTGLEASPVVFGDGLRCVQSPVVRLSASNGIAGVSTHTLGHSAMAGAGTFYYQAWLRNQPSTFCDPFAAFSLSSGQILVW